MTTAVEVAERGHQLAAWVNFNGTLAMTVGSSYGPDAPPADYSSPNPIRAAYNVASITDNGTGDYTVNFATAMPDNDYVVTACGRHVNGVSDHGVYVCIQTSDGDSGVGTSSVRISTHQQSSALQDSPIVSVAIFR